MRKTIQRLLSLALCLLLCAGLLPGTVWAAEIVDSGTCGDNLTWTLDSEGKLTISGTGEMRDYDSPWYESRSSIHTVEIRSGVTSIGNYAFNYCDSLTSVTIPNSVTSIGNYAFEDCSSLTSVHIDDLAAWCSISFGSSYSNPLYYAENLYLKGELLTDCIIPDSVTSIGSYAFCDYSSLTSVTIPNSVTSIGDYAFYWCTSLASVTIPNSVTSIGGGAFFWCDSLTDVYYGGTEDQWNAIEGDGKPSGNRITIHYFDADPSNPLGQSQPNIVGEGDEAAAVVNFASPTDRPMTVYGVRYSAAGQLLGIDAYALEAGQSGQLDIPFENGDYLRIFATDADTYAPLCKNLQVDRPA